jgi:hypothetical protein
MSERRIINGELCEQVTNPANLRLMDIIYIDCPWHPRIFHRGCLIGYLNNVPTRTVNSEGQISSGWEFMPKPATHPNATTIMVSDDSAREGLVWRVAYDAEALKKVSKLVAKV